MSGAQKRDESPTRVQVISDLRPWATVLNQDGSHQRTVTSITDEDGVPRRPLQFDEEVFIPKWQADLLSRGQPRHVVIVGR